MTMALRDLLAAIEAEAAADINRLRAERDRETAAIIEDAGRRAAELKRSAVAAAEQTEREAGERRLAAARHAIAGRLREAQEAAYQQIARDVRAGVLAARERDDYPAILAALLHEARSALPAGSNVQVAQADEVLIRRLLQGEPRLRVTVTLPNTGGVEVTDGAGAVARNTLEDRLAAAEPELRGLVGRLLAEDQALVSA
jgi:V/A-type H+/Na+-transporting ATPase subunit E